MNALIKKQPRKQYFVWIHCLPRSPYAQDLIISIYFMQLSLIVYHYIYHKQHTYSICEKALYNSRNNFINIYRLCRLIFKILAMRHENQFAHNSRKSRDIESRLCVVLLAYNQIDELSCALYYLNWKLREQFSSIPIKRILHYNRSIHYFTSCFAMVYIDLQYHQELLNIK